MNNEDIKRTDSINWALFLQQQPPGSMIKVIGAFVERGTHYPGLGTRNAQPSLIVPEIQIHCPQDTCGALMFFHSEDGGLYLKANFQNVFLTYSCKNCNKYQKTFAVMIRLNPDGVCEAYKIGEHPPFGPPIPSRALRLIESDRDFFLSGRRCENQGLGIGAFAYYRRVVEDQWSRLVDEIIKVSKRISASVEIIKALEISKDEKQFAKAIKDVKEAIPPALMINGYNPLTMLHNALSQGVHNLSDEDCLSLATSIRVVLVELAEKIGDALKNEKELNDAVSRLIKTTSDKKNIKDNQR